MNLPDGLPRLAAGPHEEGSGKACLMQYVSLLAGEPWSDLPACTHPYLAYAAQGINDMLTDTYRPLLVPLICRLFGTSADSVEIREALDAYARPDYRLPAASTAWRCAGLWSIYAYQYSAAVDWLSGLIDVYDQASGRLEHRELTPADLRDLAERVSA